MVIPESVPPPMEVMILDGRTATFNVFCHKGNQGGSGSVPRQVTEGGVLSARLRRDVGGPFLRGVPLAFSPLAGAAAGAQVAG
jgi:hypothetical protein